MKTVQVGKYKLEIYDSIEDLPIRRFHKFNKFLLIDSGVGSDFNDVNTKISKISRYIDRGDSKNAKIELENIRQALYLITEETNARHLSFVPLIKSINGEPFEDISDENIRTVHQKLNDVPTGFFDHLLRGLKKKIDSEINLYFPNQFDDPAIKEYFDRLKSRALLQLDTLIRDSDNTILINQVDDFLLLMARPKVFSGSESSEIKFNKQFEDMCLFLSHELGKDVEQMSVLQFYNSFDYIKKQQKQKQQNGR